MWKVWHYLLTEYWTCSAFHSVAGGVAFPRSAVACLYSGGNLHQQLTEVTDLYGLSGHEEVTVTRCEKALGLQGEERFTTVLL